MEPMFLWQFQFGTRDVQGPWGPHGVQNHRWKQPCEVTAVWSLSPALIPEPLCFSVKLVFPNKQWWRLSGLIPGHRGSVAETSKGFFADKVPIKNGSLESLEIEDVPMIQEAHVGVGVSGLQAAFQWYQMKSCQLVRVFPLSYSCVCLVLMFKERKGAKLWMLQIFQLLNFDSWNDCY